VKTIKLNLSQRLKVLATGDVSSYREQFLSGADMQSVTVDAETAMKYSVVNACIRVRAETFASVPVMLYKKTKDGREPANDIPIYDILHSRPNSEMAPFNFKETMMTNFDISGNAICERQYNKSGELIGLYPYPHDTIKIERDKATRLLIYVIGNGADKRVLQRGEVLHIPNMSFNGVVGMSPIAYAAASIRLGMSYEDYGVNFYKNAAMPSGVFEAPNALSDISFKHLKEGVKENYTGMRNAGIPMILEEGLKWQQVTVNPIDAQLLESKLFQIEDICRIYRVPQHMVNKLDRSTFSNIEEMSLEFVMYTMLPVFKRYEDNINMQLLTAEERKAGYYVEAKIDGLLRGSQTARAAAYASGRQWGYLSANDILRLENRPTIGEAGDIYLTPSNMIDSTKTNDSAGAQNSAKLLQDIANMIAERG